jgi:antitoxin (DNA-binding transcriptional repressor) of toxin-antitoxin stability system
MIKRGIRELWRRGCKYVDRLRRGDTIQVTDRDRAVALLMPIAEGSVIDRLTKEGRLSEATGDLLDLGPPIPPAEGIPLPSAILSELREHER